MAVLDSFSECDNDPVKMGSLLQRVLLINGTNVVQDSLELIRAGANLEERHNLGHTALTLAALKGHVSVVEALIAAEAEIDVKDNSGATPLTRAAEYGEKDCVEALLRAGANLEIRNNKNCTARMVADENGHTTVARILKEAELEAAEAAEAAKKQFLDDTDFSKGLERPIVATKPLRPKMGPA